MNSPQICLNTVIYNFLLGRDAFEPAQYILNRWRCLAFDGSSAVLLRRNLIGGLDLVGFGPRTA